MSESTKPLLSICCTTYNHENYIAQAIDGFLMQLTSFPIEILIHDDASIDRTAEIIRRYELEHPDVIKVIYQSENQFSKGRRPMLLNFERAQGEYIAFCEGDDYWTDPHKLQKQADFLEKNPTMAFCGHAVKQIDANGTILQESQFNIFEDKHLTPEEIAFGHLGVPTLSLLFRNYGNFPSHSLINGDRILLSFLSNFGEGYLSKENMGVRRVHPGGIWSLRPIKEQVDARTLTLLKIPKLIASDRKSLAYFRLFIHSIKEDYSWKRKLKNIPTSFIMALFWLRPASLRFICVRLKKKLNRTAHLQQSPCR
ncbi:MAG: glycosyltransferase [Nitrococcus mobilis]|nr:glycosyltransferase [Nitrococcus mobilis]